MTVHKDLLFQETALLNIRSSLITAEVLRMTQHEYRVGSSTGRGQYTNGSEVPNLLVALDTQSIYIF